MAGRHSRSPTLTITEILSESGPIPSSMSGITVPVAGTKRRASVASGQVYGLSEADIEERVCYSVREASYMRVLISL